MFTIRKLRPGALSVLLAAASPTIHAATEDNPWGLQFFAGDSVGTQGDFMKSHRKDISDLGVIDPGLSGTSGSLALDTVSYDDIYKSRYDVGTELSYAVNENIEAYGRFDYNAMDGQRRSIGLVTTSDLATSMPVVGDFKDADTYTLMLGSRYYVPTGDAWKVFGGVGLGATRLPEMSGSIDIPDASLSLKGVRFARATTVFAQSLQAGIDFHTPSSVDMQFAIGANHMAAAHAGDDAQLAALGFDTTHEGGDRWSFPITLGATYRF